MGRKELRGESKCESTLKHKRRGWLESSGNWLIHRREKQVEVRQATQLDHIRSCRHYLKICIVFPLQ